MIALARQHVATGRRIIARQKLLIETLRAHGRSTDHSETMLDAFTRSQRIFEEHLEFLLKKADKVRDD
jgi:hypothetical protein